MPRITFLTAADGRRMGKVITSKVYPGNPKSQITITPYPLVKEVTSVTVSYNTLKDAYSQIISHAEQGACLINGGVLRPLFEESRAGQTDRNAELSLLTLDFDDIQVRDVTEILHALGLGDTDYILQYSASSQTPGKEQFLSAHVFMLLEDPVSPDDLNAWLRYKNLSVPQLKSELALTKSHVALHYGLDITMSQPTRIVYIAPPEFVDLADPHGAERCTFVSGRNCTIKLDMTLVPKKQLLDEAKTKLLTELRKEAGLPEFEYKTTRRKGYDGTPVDVLKNPEHMHIADVQEARGFTYMNLNGGDSLGYYHPIEKPDLLYNFKGEAVLPIADINPEYFEKAKVRATHEKRRLAAVEREVHRVEDLAEANGMFDQMTREEIDHAPEQLHFYFTDDDSSAYRVGTYYAETRNVAIRPAKNKTQLEEFAMQFGLPLPNAVPRCKVMFDPTSVDIYMAPGAELGRINTYRPSIYKLQAKDAGATMVPPAAIHMLLTHILGGDKEFVAHFYNWFAYIFQTGKKTQTAWLFSGCPGSGKDTFMDHVIAPMIGREQFTTRRLDQLEDQFDDELPTTQFAWINEASLDKLRNKQKVFDKLNEIITGIYIGVRRLFTAHATMKSFLNVCVGTNHFNAIRVDANDRRWNIPPRQEFPLRSITTVGPKLHDKLKAELSHFATFMASYAVNEDAVKLPLDSQAKRDLQAVTMESPKHLVSAIEKGDLGYLISLLPPPGPTFTIMVNADRQGALHQYVGVLDDIVNSFKDGGDRTHLGLTRENLQSLFRYALNWEHMSPAKFASACGRYGLSLHNSYISIAGSEASHVGRYLDFSLDKERLVYYKANYCLELKALHAVKT